MTAQRDDDGEPVEVAPVPDVSGRGKPHTAVAFGPANVVIKGKTTAHFDGGVFHTEGVATDAGTGCKQCKAKDCVHVAGRAVTVYTVTTNVSLPSLAQFKNLTPCQRAAVKEAIENRLAAHEQDHVSAFGQYNGTTDQSFDLTTCRAGFRNAVQALVNTEERQRRADANAASAALDPFQIDVDLDCTDD